MWEIQIVQQALSLSREPVARAGRPQVRPEELGRTFGQLAAKLKAGLSVSQALYALSVETRNAHLATVLKSVKAGVDKGRPLGEALLDFPEVFEPMTVDMLAAGEQVDQLVAGLRRVSTYLIETEKVARSLYAATSRPARALGLGLLVWAAVLALADLRFESLGRSVPASGWPWATHLVLQVAGVVRSFLPVVLAVVVLLCLAWRLAIRGERGVLLRNALLLQAPIIGNLWRARALADFARATGALAAAGIPPRLAVERGALASDNVAVRGAVVLALDKLTKGRDLPTALAEVGLLSRAEIHPLQAAERRGNFGEVMQKYAETSDQELLRQSARLKNVSESLAILVVGLLVVGTTLGFFGPALFGL